MFDPSPPEAELLKSLLRPLLEDFHYWFDHFQSLLTQESISFLSRQQQAELLSRVKQAQQEVYAAQALLQATDGQAGIEMRIFMQWHQLVAEYWQVATRLRTQELTE